MVTVPIKLMKIYITEMRRIYFVYLLRRVPELREMEFRQDGRKNDELRHVNASVGVVENCDGSAFFEIGNTKVLATVWGPIDLEDWRQTYSDVQDDILVKCNLSYSTFCRTSRRESRIRGTDRQSSELCRQVEKAFHDSIFKDFFQKSRVEVDLMVLQSDGGELSSCINATTLAFLDAGIPIKSLVCACSAAIIYPKMANDMIADMKPQFLLDVSNTETSYNNRTISINLALQGRTNNALTWNLERGKANSQMLDKLFSLATLGCHNIYDFMQKYYRNI
ncbi:hypothetical protein MXB_1476 [Myxobolus squamalis]|nr:hypothetical protein MXB_1476 [Myxobolus squamalis]